MPITQDRLYEIVSIARRFYELQELQYERVLNIYNSDTIPEPNKAVKILAEIDRTRRAINPRDLEVIVREESHYKYTHKDNERRAWNMRFLRSGQRAPVRRRDESKGRVQRLEQERVIQDSAYIPPDSAAIDKALQELESTKAPTTAPIGPVVTIGQGDVETIIEPDDRALKSEDFAVEDLLSPTTGSVHDVKQRS